jgi:hypothetical protein
MGVLGIFTGLWLVWVLGQFWWEFLTVPRSERADGHGFFDFYLWVTAYYGLPAAVLLSLGWWAVRTPRTNASRDETQTEA